MKKKKGHKPIARGSARMQEFRYHKCEVWFDQSECDLVVEASRKAGLRLATWVRCVAVNAACGGAALVQRADRREGE